MAGVISSIYESNSVRGKVMSRKDQNGQEAIIELDKLRERTPHLCSLKTTFDEAKTDYSEAIKSVAEISGLQASVIRKYIAAKVSDKVQTAKREADQLSLVFEEADGPAIQQSIPDEKAVSAG